MHTSTARRRGVAAALLAALTTTLLMGCSAAEPAQTHNPAPAAATAQVGAPLNSLPPVPASVPTTLQIDALGLAAEVGAMDTGACPVLNPPTNREAYWIGCRALAGTNSDGTVFIIGHTLGNGGGVFDNLHTITVGNDVRVSTANGALTYRVDRTARYDKYGAAQQASEMRERVPGRLVLVTCVSDPSAAVEQNFVAFATLVDAIPNAA